MTMIRSPVAQRLEPKEVRGVEVREGSWSIMDIPALFKIYFESSVENSYGHCSVSAAEPVFFLRSALAPGL